MQFKFLFDEDNSSSYRYNSNDYYIQIKKAVEQGRCSRVPVTSKNKYAAV